MNEQPTSNTFNLEIGPQLSSGNTLSLDLHAPLVGALTKEEDEDKGIYELVASNHPLLKTKLERFDFNNPPINPVYLANKLIRTMLHFKGLGLAANQCGLPYRVFVLWSSPTKVCFNPVIADVSEEHILLEEGCLTFPNLFIKIKRPKLVRIRYVDALGESQTDKFTGISARCVQHEVDHLNGILYTSIANSIHLERAMRHKKQLDRRNK